jgi:hypothetical protein
MSDTQIIELDDSPPTAASQPWRAGSLTLLVVPLVVVGAMVALLSLRGAQNSAEEHGEIAFISRVTEHSWAPNAGDIVTFAPPPIVSHESAPQEVLENQRWTGIGPTHSGRGDVAEAVLGGDAYVIGGSGTSDDGRHVYRYDRHTGMRLRVADLPISLDHAMAATLGDRIYVFGGFEFGRPSDRVFSLTANSAAWTEHAPMPAARAAGGAAVVGDRIYIVGGVGDGGGWIRDTWAYDTGGRWWTDLARLPTPRDHLAVGAYHGRVCAAGGNGANQIFQCFDPARNEWGWMPDLRRPVVGGRAAQAAGWFWVIGQDVHVFTNDHWHFGPPLQTARRGHALVAIDDALYVIEGSAGIDHAPMEMIQPLP